MGSNMSVRGNTHIFTSPVTLGRKYFCTFLGCFIQFLTVTVMGKFTLTWKHAPMMSWMSSVFRLQRIMMKQMTRTDESSYFFSKCKYMCKNVINLYTFSVFFAFAVFFSFWCFYIFCAFFFSLLTLSVLNETCRASKYDYITFLTSS